MAQPGSGGTIAMQSLPANAASTSGVSTSAATGNAISSGSVATANSPSFTTQATSIASGIHTSNAAAGTTSTNSTQASQVKTTSWSRFVTAWQIFAQGFTILGVLVAILWGIWTWWLAYKADARADWTSEQQFKQSCIYDRVSIVYLKSCPHTEADVVTQSRTLERLRPCPCNANGALQAAAPGIVIGCNLEVEDSGVGYINWSAAFAGVRRVYTLHTHLSFIIYGFPLPSSQPARAGKALDL